MTTSSETSITFKVIETRPKSYKLEASDGTTFFIMRKWRRADGTFTPSATKAYKERLAAIAASNTMRKLPIAWENDTAVGVDFRAELWGDSTMDTYRGGTRTMRVRAFFPKSMMVDGAFPEWLVSKKEVEAMSREGCGGSGWVIIGYWD